MKKTLFYLLSLTSFQSFSQTEVPLLNHVITMGGSSSESCSSIANDNVGNIYATGTFVSVADFDPSATTLNLVSNGDRDIFIQKTDNSGNLIWAKSIGGSLFDSGNSIKVDAVGNVYIAGNFKNTVDFDPGSGIVNLTSAGEYDAFILKLNSNGDFVWVKSIGGTYDDIANSIDLDNSGNIYCTGYFYGTIDFDPNAGIQNLSSNGSYDAYIQKLDPNGNLVWVKTFGGSSVDAASHINLDIYDNVLVTGHFRNSVDFDPSVNTFNLSSNGNYDIFILKLDSNGDFQWATSSGGSLDDRGKAITTDNNGNVICTGYFYGTVDFNTGVGTENITSNGNADVFIQKLDANGSYLWTKTCGSVEDDKGNSITTDIDGNIFTTGLFRSSIDIDPSANNILLISNGIEDIFIQKLSVNGDYKWASSFGGSNYDSGRSILVNNSNNVICAGSFGSTVDFDPSSNIQNTSSVGGYDAFILNLSQCQTTNSVDVHTACNSFTWVDGITYTASNNTATYTYTNQNGCDSTLTLDLTINILDITVTDNSPTLISNANSANYQWVDCDNGNVPIANETNQTFTASSNGNYAVEVSQYGCTLISNCISVNNVGLNENNSRLISKIYPNPTKDKVTIIFNELHESIQIKIFDMSGRQIDNLFYNKANNISFSIDGESGIYFIEIYSESGIFSNLKIVKE